MATATRKCALKSCSKRNPPETMIIKGVNAWCDNDCQTAHALLNLKNLRAANDRTAKNAEKEKRKAARAKKEAFYANDLTKQKALTQTAANKLCSLLDAGRNCISCGRPLRGGRFQHSSHFKSRGANSFLRYSMLNLHLSCVVCNLWKSGEIEGFRAGLIERYGQPLLDCLDNAPRSKDWTIPELTELRTIMNAEIRRLQRGESPSRDWRTIPVDTSK